MTDEISRDELEALKARVRRLESKVESDDENHSERNEPVTRAFLDTYDKAVLNTLDEGEEYSADHLTRTYKARTRLTQRKTIKRRIKRLAENDVLKHIEAARFTYTGREKEW